MELKLLKGGPFLSAWICFCMLLNWEHSAPTFRFRMKIMYMGGGDKTHINY